MAETIRTFRKSHLAELQQMAQDNKSSLGYGGAGKRKVGVGEGGGGGGTGFCGKS